MFKIAIVEDEIESAQRLTGFLNDYGAEYGVMFHITHYQNGYNFLEEYSNDYDLVFMDVDMPYMSGLQAAKELRKKDSVVTLVFVTHLAKYAINGYEVGALDYILKPVNYNAFKIKLDRALGSAKRRQREVIVLPSSGGIFKVDLASLNYIEIDGHNIVYHTSEGNVEAYGTLRSIETVLPKGKFFKCNRCYLVNMRNVSRVDGTYVYIGDEKLLLSRPRKNEFIKAMHDFVSDSQTE